jgi:cytochrome b561
MAHMWAYSTSTPSSSRPDASISIHNSYTRFTLDFAQGITANATPSLLMTSASPSPTSPTLSSASNKSTISNTSSNVILAHMLCMVIAWMFLAPFGAIIARYGRTMFTWYPTHRAFQIGTLVLVIVGFSLGIAGVSKEGGRHFSQRHHQIGLIIFILLFVQCFLGQWAHSYRDKTGKRHICVIHMPLGIVLIGLSVWNTLTGFKLWSVQLTPNTPYFVYGWISLLTLVYIAGMYFVPQEITQARDAGISHQSEESVTLEKIHRHDTDRLSPIQEFDHYQQRRKFMILLEQDESVSNT